MNAAMIIVSFLGFLLLLLLSRVFNKSTNTLITSLLGLQAYKVYYTTDSSQPIASWNSQVVDNNLLTTISDLVPLTIYTIRVQAVTSVGSGPLSAPVQVGPPRHLWAAR